MLIKQHITSFTTNYRPLHLNKANNAIYTKRHSKY